MPIVLNGSGPVTGVTSLNTTVSDTEIGYLDGVTSALQTQINTAGGLVKITDNTFSSATAVNVDNCFTSTYENYLLVWRFTTGASTGNFCIRLRASGTSTTTNYDLYGGYTGATSANVSNVAAGEWNIGGGFNSNTGQGQVTLFRPQVAASTLGIISMADDRHYIIHYGLNQTASTSFDGFSLFMSSGTFSGALRLYGMRN